jgi:hypothetical protein
VIIDWEFDSMADLEAAADEYFGSPKAKEFYVQWLELVEAARAEMWRLQ